MGCSCLKSGNNVYSNTRKEIKEKKDSQIDRIERDSQNNSNLIRNEVHNSDSENMRRNDEDLSENMNNRESENFNSENIYRPHNNIIRNNNSNRNEDQSSNINQNNENNLVLRNSNNLGSVQVPRIRNNSDNNRQVSSQVNSSSNNNTNNRNNNNRDNISNNVHRVRNNIRTNQNQISNQIQDPNEPYLESRHDPFFNFEEIGEGIKKTKAYICPISKEDLDKKIQDFWDSRRDNSKEIWECLRTVCCPDIDAETANTIITMNSITLYKDNLSAVFDSKGNLYEVPNYCINPPYKYLESSFEQSFEDKPIDIRIRYDSTEYKIHITSNKKVSELKEGLIANISKTIKNIEKIRLFYKGKELKDKKSLNKIDNNGILQMAVILKDPDV